MERIAVGSNFVKAKYTDTLKNLLTSTCSNTSTLIAELSVGVGIAAILACSTINALAQEASTDKTIELKVGNKSYPVSYHFTNGGSINGISSVKNTLLMNLTSPSHGILELIIPRELADVNLIHLAKDFVLEINGHKIRHSGANSTNSCEQTSLIIPIESGYSNVKVSWALVLLAFNPSNWNSYPKNIFLSKTIQEEGQNFTISMATDAKKCDTSFSKGEKKIHIDIRGRDEVNNSDHGSFFLRVPHILLDGNYSVLVDGKPVTFDEHIFPAYGNTEMFDSEISFNYTKEATKIDIIGTTAIPEFNTIVLTVTTISIAAAAVIIFYKKVQKRTI